MLHFLISEALWPTARKKFLKGAIKLLFLLFDGDAWVNIEAVWVGWLHAGLDFIVSGGGNHGAVIAGKFELREEATRKFLFGSFS